MFINSLKKSSTRLLALALTLVFSLSLVTTSASAASLFSTKKSSNTNKILSVTIKKYAPVTADYLSFKACEKIFNLTNVKFVKVDLAIAYNGLLYQSDSTRSVTVPLVTLTPATRAALKNILITVYHLPCETAEEIINLIICITPKPIVNPNPIAP